MSYETADILDSAADIIERNGWWHGGKGDGLRATCASNAIATAGSLPIRTRSYLCAHDSLLRAAGIEPAVQFDVGAVFRWNDAPGRTEQEVLDALRLAAKQERAAEDQS